MASGKGEPPIPVRFVPGTAVRISAPWLRTRTDATRSRLGLRVVSTKAETPSETPPGKTPPGKPDETKD